MASGSNAAPLGARGDAGDMSRFVMPDDGPPRQTKEDRRKARQLEEARKEGTLAPELDPEGNPINPHIPSFIAKAPWYVDKYQGAASLSHQSHAEGIVPLAHAKWYDRGKKVGPAATKYRKGACENCGAMSHKARDCVERPRKMRARWSGKDIQADEVVTKVDMSYEGKRDRWNGYDPQEHDKIVAAYEQMEALQTAMQPQHDEDEDDGDDDKYAEDEDAEMPGQKFDASARMSTRNLRLREDTASYLKNEHGTYNPKSRKMKDDGAADVDIKLGDGEFHRPAVSGEMDEINRLQKFAEKVDKTGELDINLQSNPTAGALLHKKYTTDKDMKRDAAQQTILDKYGGSDHLKSLPPELQHESEMYVEYDKTGKVVKGGAPPVIVRSRYEEDIYPQNHSSVFGSWYDKRTGTWGYACCHQTTLHSYCTGEAGIEAQTASDELATTL